MGYAHLKICSHCGHRIPTEADVALAEQIPCSEYHVRCVRCSWPVAKTLVTRDGLCYRCMDGNTRRNYNRKHGRLLYGEIDGSTDPKDYLMHGRMTMHGDEAELLERRRAKSRQVNEAKLATRRAQEAAAEEAQRAKAQEAERIRREQEAAKPPPLKPPIDETRWAHGQCQRPSCPEKAINKPYCGWRCQDQHLWEHFQAMEALREEKRHAHVPEPTDRPHRPEPVSERSHRQPSL